MNSGFRAEKKARLYSLLEYEHVLSCGQVASVLHLEKCFEPEGKLLVEYLKELQMDKKTVRKFIVVYHSDATPKSSVVEKLKYQKKIFCRHKIIWLRSKNS